MLTGKGEGGAVDKVVGKVTKYISVWMELTVWQIFISKMRKEFFRTKTSRQVLSLDTGLVQLVSVTSTGGPQDMRF